MYIMPITSVSFRWQNEHVKPRTFLLVYLKRLSGSSCRWFTSVRTAFAPFDIFVFYRWLFATIAILNHDALAMGHVVLSVNAVVIIVINV